MITAEELRGGVKPTIAANGASTVHKLEDDETDPPPAIPRSRRVEIYERKLKILVTLEAGAKTAKQLAQDLGEDLNKTYSACVMLSHAGLIECAPKNTGYQLTPKGVKALSTERRTTTSTPTQEKPVATKKPKKRATKRDSNADERAMLKGAIAAEPSFAVTDEGALSIITVAERMQLSVAATKRLAVFIERTKDLRK